MAHFVQELYLLAFVLALDLVAEFTKKSKDLCTYTVIGLPGEKTYKTFCRFLARSLAYVFKESGEGSSGKVLGKLQKTNNELINLSKLSKAGIL